MQLPPNPRAARRSVVSRRLLLLILLLIVGAGWDHRSWMILLLLRDPSPPPIGIFPNHSHGAGNRSIAFPAFDPGGETTQLQYYIRITQRWMMQRTSSDDGRFPEPSTMPTVSTTDWVELSHCDISSVNVTPFVTQFVLPVVPVAIQALRRQYRSSLLELEEASMVSIEMEDMAEQLVGQLLEQYVTAKQMCNFSRYRPSIVDPYVTSVDVVRPPPWQQQRSFSSSSSSSATPFSSKEDDASATRLLFVISAFQDVTQLQRLVAAVHLPQHYIMIHLDEYSDDSWRQEIQDRILSLYDNVLCVQFGAVVYRTDSLSLIHLRLLRWMTLEEVPVLPYDYVVLCDGLAFPLHAPHEFIHAIRSAQLENGQPREVWLGALTHKGQSVSTGTSCFDHLLRQKRVIYTRRIRMGGNSSTSTTTTVWKFHQRLPKRILAQYPPIPDGIRSHMIYKSTSGNQGVYSRSVVEQLLNSDSVMELFALSKYGCCCCLEEHNWIAALSMIGYASQALQQTSMFQVWGGRSSQCRGSMSNAVLSRNTSICYRSEDPNRDGRSMYFYGDSLGSEIIQAKHRGVLMARKFRSTTEEDPDLMMIQDIQTHVWRQSRNTP
jgi:hypothetical protein